MRNIVLVVLGLALAVWVGYETLLAPGDVREVAGAIAPGSGADHVKEIPVDVSRRGSEADREVGPASGPDAPVATPSPAGVKPRDPPAGVGGTLRDDGGLPAQLSAKGAHAEAPAPANSGRTTAPDLASVVARTFDLVEDLTESGRPLEAMETLTRFLARLPEGMDRDAVRDRLDACVDRFLFSRARLERGIIEHRIERGDTLDRLCRKWSRESGWNIAPGLVCRTNGISDPRRIRAGDRLKVITLPLRIEVSRADHRLIVFLGNVAAKEYSVGLGRDDATPTGEFIIRTKQIDPTWTWQGKVYPAGDPDNVLGTRWLGFENRDDLFGYGIHGTTAPESIGQDESNGCVRMLNAEVEELFEWVPRDTRVRIF